MKLLKSETSYLFVVLLLISAVTYVSFSNRQGPLVELFDYGEHAASIREMAANLISPGNPLLDDKKPTLRYTPYIFFAALILKFSPLSLFEVLRIASFCSFLFFTAGTYLFSREYFRDRKMPLYVLVTLLFMWGKPFNYSNEYSLRFFSYTAFYPSIVSFSISLVALYLLLVFIREGKTGFFLLYVVFSVMIFLTHPLTGSFFLLSSFALLLTESTCRLKHTALYCVCIIIVGSFALCWPYYSFFEALTTSTTTAWYDSKGYLYDTANVYKIGPALLGLPVMVYLLAKRKHMFIVLGFIFCAASYVFGKVMNVFLFERYIFFMVFFLHLALAWYLRTLRVFSFVKEIQSLNVLTARSGIVVCLSAILFASIFYQSSKLGFEQAGFEINFKPLPVIAQYKNPLENYIQIRSVLKKGDIVLSDPLTSWLIPAFTGAKIIVLYHNCPMVHDNNERRINVKKFYASNATASERKRIIGNYSVTHVLLNRYRMKDTFVNRIRSYFRDYRISDRMINDMKKQGSVVFENSDFILFQVQI